MDSSGFRSKTKRYSGAPQTLPRGGCCTSPWCPWYRSLRTGSSDRLISALPSYRRVSEFAVDQFLQVQVSFNLHLFDFYVTSDGFIECKDSVFWILYTKREKKERPPIFQYRRHKRSVFKRKRVQIILVRVWIHKKRADKKLGGRLSQAGRLGGEIQMIIK